jgi:serine/threonine protein kinase/Tfp pilus assembly protein PilF
MGAVYEAEQEQPRRVVAVKIIKSSYASPELLRRFERESEALARLHHPGIAQIFEAGTAESPFGPQPYFAMEFIAGGMRLTQFCESRKLTPRQRLELMAQICDAVDDAHQHGIIHRDLKPGNILVDESSHAKILDFGVARITDSDAEATRQTDVGQIVGTLAYMSPEQALADPLQVDIRSDVYALGVILYELLAGRLPYSLSHKLHEAILTIREEEPAALTAASRVYRGDIETIVGKALEKDKTRRYASAGELAGDIRRYLSDQPIIARPASFGYRLNKFTRRHRTLVAAAATVFAVLTAGIVISTREALSARQAQQSAQAVNDFLQEDLLAQASASNQARPSTSPDPDLKVRTALDRAASRIEGKFASQPLIEASIRQTIGTTYSGLGLYDEAQKHIARALDLRRRLLGEKDPDTLRSMSALALVDLYQSKVEDSRLLYANLVEVQRRVLGAEHPDTLYNMSQLAAVYRILGKFPESARLFTQTLEIQRRVLKPDDDDLLDTLNEAANLKRNMGDLVGAEALFQQAIDGRRRRYGEEHPDTLSTMAGLAMTYRAEGKTAEAVDLGSRILEIRRRVLGDEHSETLTAMNNLSVAYRDQGNYEAAERLLVHALEITQRVRGAESPDAAVLLHNLGTMYAGQGKYPESEAMFQRSLGIRRRAFGADHPDTLITMDAVASLYAKEGKDAQAEPLFRQTIEGRRRVLGPEHRETLDSLEGLARVQLHEHNYAAAEAALRVTLQGYEKIAPNRWFRYNSQSLLGASLAGQKKFTDAEPLLVSGYEGLVKLQSAIAASDRHVVREAGQRIAVLYQEWGKPAQAAEWRRKLAKQAP